MLKEPVVAFFVGVGVALALMEVLRSPSPTSMCPANPLTEEIEALKHRSRLPLVNGCPACGSPATEDTKATACYLPPDDSIASSSRHCWHLHPKPGVVPHVPTKSEVMDVLHPFGDPYKDFPNHSHRKPLEGPLITSIGVNEAAHLVRVFSPTFVAEAGSFMGNSAINMANALPPEGFVVCIDPWLGSGDMINSLNDPASQWPGHLKPAWGRSTLYDAFMVNVAAHNVSKKVIPLSITSIAGARIMQVRRWTPQLVIVDSAHDLWETYLELCLFWNLVPIGGGIAGDDYNWYQVRHDVNYFVQEVDETIYALGQRVWYVKKTKDSKCRSSKAAPTPSNIPDIRKH